MVSKCLIVKRKAIRCQICDKLLAKQEDKTALEECWDINQFQCNQCFEKYYKKHTDHEGKYKGWCNYNKRRKGIFYEIIAHYKKGDKIPDKEWIISKRCWEE